MHPRFQSLSFVSAATLLFSLVFLPPIATNSAIAASPVRATAQIAPPPNRAPVRDETLLGDFVAPVPERTLLRDEDEKNQPQPSAPTSERDNLPPPTISVPEGTLLRDDDKNNQTQLPWVLVSNNRNQVVSLPVKNKISALFTKQGLTPISCSTNPVVIVRVNNLYVACASPTSNYPPGNYNATIPDL